VSLVFLVSVGTHESLAVTPENSTVSCLVRAMNGLLDRGDVQPHLPHAIPKPRKIENLDDLLLAFSQGLSPDLANPSQRDAFEFYRRMRFGDPNTRLNPESLDEIAKIIKKHPELEKEAFRDFKLEVRERTYPVTKELEAYLGSQVASAGQTRANLFQVDANSGYWKKVLQYDEAEVPKVEQLARDVAPEQKAAFRDRAKQQKEEARAKWMAFLDGDLPQMMEGVRRSLEEKGYKLAVPDDVGDHNGISNENIIRSFVTKSIQTDRNQPIVGFKPHNHSYSFPSKYSRAEESLPSHAVAPLQLPEGVELAPGELTIPWKTGDLDLNRLVQASVNLKNSPNLEDKLRYIPSMKAIELAGLKVDPDFDATLAKWMADSREPFQIRKRSLLFQWTENSKPLSQLLPSFSRNDQIQLLQNLMDTPRYRDLILKDKNNVPDLIVTARRNKKVRDILTESFAGDKRDVIQPMMDRVLDAQDISDEVASALIKQVKTGLGSADVEEVLKTLKLVHGTSLEDWLRNELLTSYASRLNGETSLGRALSRCLSSPDPVARDFGLRLFTKVDSPRSAQFKVVKAFQEIMAIQREDPTRGDFIQAATLWMKSEKVNPELKSSFLLTHFGSKGHLYESYRAAVPRDQLPIVMRKIDEVTNLGVFERLAATEGNPALKALFENGKLESFEYRPYRFPEGGERVRLGSPTGEPGRFYGTEDLHEVTLTKSFEMQATPVTQLQWSLVMGENPSHFQTGGQVIAINGRDIPMNPNRPVERVSWEDAQKYIQKLNQMDPYYDYWLPTESEWEFAARAGTDTPFSFGSNVDDLGTHAFYPGNSGNKTNDVASLQPNPNGLYDMHGSVSEWTQDWWEDVRPPHAVDPTGPIQGPGRVVRGGGWNSSRESLRSAYRIYASPDYRSAGTGFRVLRTLKRIDSQ
jgi:sulfatase modifying factor 1